MALEPTTFHELGGGGDGAGGRAMAGLARLVGLPGDGDDRWRCPRRRGRRGTSAPRCRRAPDGAALGDGGRPGSACRARQLHASAWPRATARTTCPTFENPQGRGEVDLEGALDEALPDQESRIPPTRPARCQVLVFCNHCDNPPCVRVCPTGATWKRDDGIVMMDWHRCIGCRYCIAACPYGSRSFNWRDPRPQIAAIRPGFPTRTRGVVEKCNLCEERLLTGEAPACVEACSQKAIVFGDLEDAELATCAASWPNARASAAAGARHQPAVYYLV